MPDTHRVPILLAKDHGGLWTAWLLDLHDSAIATTRASVLEQMETLLRAAERSGTGWLYSLDLQKPEIRWIEVNVFPEYKSDDRRFPCPETVGIRLPIVVARNEAGETMCSMPTLGVNFESTESDAVRELAVHHALQELRGKTPAEIARLLPPAEVELAEIVSRPHREREAPPDWSKIYPSLAAIADPIGDGAHRGEARAWLRDDAISELTRLIARDGASVAVIGPTGCGKSGVIAAAARAIARTRSAASRTVPRPALWRTSGARIIAGMRWLGQWQERLETAIGELSRAAGVLYLENWIDTVRQGGQSAESIAAFLAPFVEAGELRIVTETTAEELDACARIMPGAASLFRKFHLAPLASGDAIEVARRSLEAHGQAARIAFTDAVPATIVRLHERFLPYAALPGPIAPFVTRLCERAKRDKAPINLDAVHRLFGAQTGLPDRLLRTEIPLDPDAVAAELGDRILGQPEACRCAADVVARIKAGLQDPGRPPAALLFCGPTGVGKTALATALADVLFGAGTERNRLLRLDLSEFHGYDAPRRLVGAGSEPSAFIKEMRRQPFRIVLLDEVEKADPDIFDMLLGLLDEGRLTDALGRLTIFRGAVIILTSNVGAPTGGALGFGDAAPIDYKAAMLKVFRPEFYNRLDAIVPFHPLTADLVRAVAHKELRDLTRREGLVERRLRLEFTDPVIDAIVSEGFHPQFGARPLQRTLERRIVAPLARRLIADPALCNRTLLLDRTIDGTITISEKPENL